MGASKHVGTSKQLGQSNVWGIWTPLSVTKHAFFVLCMYWRHPNIFQTYGGIETYRKVSKHRRHLNIQGVIQTYEDTQTYREYIQINGRHPNILEVSKHMGTFKHTGGVQTYGGHSNIQGHSNIWGIQTCRAHPHIWGHQMYGGIWTLP